jgi:hypothetical protein
MKSVGDQVSRPRGEVAWVVFTTVSNTAWAKMAWFLRGAHVVSSREWLLDLLQDQHLEKYRAADL